MAKWMTAVEYEAIKRLAKKGHSFEEIAELVGRSRPRVAWATRRPLPARFWRQEGRCRYLTAAEREEISLGLAAGETLTAIAARIGRAVSTVSREVAANGGRRRYRATRAHAEAHGRARRPKTPRLAANPRLAAQVSEWLQRLWSPEKIADRLRLEYPDDPMMRVSHETIYQSLFVQGRGELRKELHRCLRSRRASRRPRHRLEHRGQIPNKVMISARPAEVADRAVPGHWEGDLLMGKNSASAIATLVERSTRYTMLLALPDGRTAAHVRAAMIEAVRRLPAELVKTLTWDQGTEMSQHLQFSIDTGIQIYFCDPGKPWQRGSNENTNGLLRDFMPKGYDLTPLTQDNLDVFAWLLNDRPRATLGGMKPSEKLAQLLATTP